MTSDIELYFHIPFCLKKCKYCDFLSFGADSPLADGNMKARYMDSLIRETVMRAEDYRENRVVSVFIGGGTPSVVMPEFLAELMAAVRKCYRLAEDVEITVEVNPGTVDRDKLDCYRAEGINRLSIGLQSADDGELATVGRIHTWRQFLDTYESAVGAGFDNINVDVMSALPGQTLDSYRSTLQRILELRPRPAHISAYSLILEEGTPLWEQIREQEHLPDGSGVGDGIHLPDGGGAGDGIHLPNGSGAGDGIHLPDGSGAGEGIHLPNEDTDREMYALTKEMLEQAGYVRYEISNYAKPGFECRHNCGYWRRRNYAGFGIGAASLINNVRYKNRDDLQAYLINPTGCREDVQVLSIQEQMEEFMFLGLRMTAGISSVEFEACFGQKLEQVYGETLRRNLKDGLLRWTDSMSGNPSDRCLALTEKGLDLANYVMAQFLF